MDAVIRRGDLRSARKRPASARESTPITTPNSIPNRIAPASGSMISATAITSPIAIPTITTTRNISASDRSGLCMKEKLRLKRARGKLF